MKPEAYMSARSWAIGLLLLASTACLARAEGESYPFEGQVTATNVYVRSGAGSNWYPTAKLNPGDRVLVVSEKFGWYQITPPPDSFSWIDMSAVDRVGGAAQGAVKTDKTYVRAGSHLEDRKSATQVVLTKGATVRIIGEQDGFYKIDPPPGATLYISKQFVNPVEVNLRTGMVERYVSTNPPPVEPPEPSVVDDTPADQVGSFSQDTAAMTDQLSAAPTDMPSRQPSTSEPAMAAQDQGKAGAPAVAAKPAPGKATKPAAPGPVGGRSAEPAPANAGEGRYRAKLEALESELVAELRKPFKDQNLAGLRRRYEEIAIQKDEYVPSAVAKIRVRQLGDRLSLRESQAALVSDQRAIEEYRAQMEDERRRIMRRRVEVAMEKYELEGQLRRSFAFPNESRRYRLVDPQSDTTLAYVDIPPEVEPNSDYLIGRLVGIRTAGQRFSPSARVPIAVAATVVDLSPRLEPPAEMGQQVTPP